MLPESILIPFPRQTCALCQRPLSRVYHRDGLELCSECDRAYFTALPGARAPTIILATLGAIICWVGGLFLISWIWHLWDVAVARTQ